MAEIETPPDGNSKESPWQKTTIPCLVRYKPSGKYYLRARFGGHPVTKCLGTDDIRIAKINLADETAKRRRSAVVRTKDRPKTLLDALAIVRGAVAANPALKGGTREFYFEVLDSFWPAQPKEGKKPSPNRKDAAQPPNTSLPSLTALEMQDWWARVAAEYKPQRANHTLMLVRRALKVARKMGSMAHDPTEELKRVPIPRTRLDLPTPEQFRAVVESIRAQRKARSDEAGDYVEFMTYSGLRPKEIKEVLVTDLLETGVRVTGGEDGTKNRQDRTVPMNPTLADLLARMRAAGRMPQVGRLFTIKAPRDALRNACIRLEIPHQRIYNLRHIFGTRCNESGVDAATFSGWMGHQDGGALAQRTYVHVHSDHDARSAARVKF